MTAPVVVVRQEARQPVYLSIREPIELGRECDGFLLVDAQVSRRHLQLDVLEGRVTVTDMGSTNGTTLDGVPISSTVALMSGSVVLAGGTTIELVSELDAAVATGRDTMQSGARSTMVAAADPAAPQPPVRPGNTSPSPTLTPPTGVVRPNPAINDDLRRTSIDLVAHSVEQTGVDMQRLHTEQGTVTIVFSDIESSTERTMALGDQVWFEVLGIHNDIIRKHVVANNGIEIKNQGDGFMLSFPGARMALTAMIEVQKELTQRAAQEPERSVSIRVGLHTGEVLVDDDGDLFGKHVVVAARVANLAAGGEILVSSLVREITSARGDVVFGESRQVELKGIEGEHTVYPVDWSESLA